jgi:Bifunctional DNA primase/polymerase, N-terminal
MDTNSTPLSNLKAEKIQRLGPSVLGGRQQPGPCTVGAAKMAELSDRPSYWNHIPRALEMIERGHRVFALPDNNKKPRKGESWLTRRTRDPKIAESRLQDTRTYGVATGEGLLVVDVDVKDGKPGDATFHELDMRHGFPNTYTVRTGSGGKHLFYKIPKHLELGGKADQLGPGVDIRCHNNYVVGPGSVVDGKEYSVLDPSPEAPCPNWILKQCEKALKRDKQYEIPLCDWDLPPNVERARHFLRYEAPPAIYRQHGDDTTIKVAAHVRDYAISESLCLDTMLDLQ